MLTVLFNLCLFLSAKEDTLRVMALRDAAEVWHTGQVFVGLPEQGISRRLGEPTSKKALVWEYWQPLGPGAHSFRWVRVVRFRDGKAVAAAMEERGVGCILVEPKGK